MLNYVCIEILIRVPSNGFEISVFIYCKTTFSNCVRLIWNIKIYCSPKALFTLQYCSSTLFSSLRYKIIYKSKIMLRYYAGVCGKFYSGINEYVPAKYSPYNNWNLAIIVCLTIQSKMSLIMKELYLEFIPKNDNVHKQNYSIWKEVFKVLTNHHYIC